MAARGNGAGRIGGWVRMRACRDAWRRIVSSSAGRMALAVGGVSVVGGLLLVLGVVAMSRHEFAERGLDPDGVMADDRYGAGMMVIDTRKAVLLVAAFIIAVVVAVALIGWRFLRREVEPLERVLQLQRDFVADASHELKTPLAVIATRIDLVEFRLRSGGEITQAIAALRGDVDRMDAILSDLLVAARGEVDPEPVDVAEAVRRSVEAVRPLAERRGVRLDVVERGGPDGPESGPDAGTYMVKGGMMGISRCLVAVIDNAIAHSPDGGVVTVELEAFRGGLRRSGARRSRIGRRCARPTATVAVRVRDRGGGIGGDPERLFRRFARDDDGTVHQGYGLGLALARDVASRYGGVVEVDSTSTKGTVMLVAFPGAESSAPSRGGVDAV